MGSPALLQNALLLRSDPIGFLSRVAKRGERVSAIELPGHCVYLVNAPELVAHLLLERTGQLRKYLFPGLLEAFGSGILNSTGSVHTTVRRAAQPAFHRAQIEEWSGSVKAIMEESLATPDSAPETDVKAIFEHLTLRVVARLLFALEVRAIAPAFFECVEEMQQLFQRAEASPAVADRFKAVSQKLHAILANLIREQPQARAEGLLFRSLDATGEVDERQLLDEVRGFLMANLPASILLTTASWLLAGHPEHQIPFRERDPHAHLDQIIKETLRLYPPGWLLAREAVESFALDGTSFAAGTVFLICVWALHRSPRIFPEPDQFRPERWKERGDLPRGAYLPFSLGARNCLGERLSRMIAGHGLAQLCSHFHLARSDRQSEIQWLPRITLSPATSVWLKLQRLDRP